MKPGRAWRPWATPSARRAPNSPRSGTSGGPRSPGQAPDDAVAARGETIAEFRDLPPAGPGVAVDETQHLLHRLDLARRPGSGVPRPARGAIRRTVAHPGPLARTRRAILSP